jgi:hypothetical protein
MFGTFELNESQFETFKEKVLVWPSTERAVKVDELFGDLRAAKWGTLRVGAIVRPEVH